jgi:hypothetical protein
MEKEGFPQKMQPWIEKRLSLNVLRPMVERDVRHMARDGFFPWPLLATEDDVQGEIQRRTAGVVHTRHLCDTMTG